MKRQDQENHNLIQSHCYNGHSCLCCRMRVPGTLVLCLDGWVGKAGGTTGIGLRTGWQTVSAEGFS